MREKTVKKEYESEEYKKETVKEQERK